MYHIVICDDDSYFIEYMAERLLESGLGKEETIFYGFQSGEELVHSLDKFERIDLLILDIQLKELDGNETARQFRSRFPMAVLVFCSGVFLPTVESFETTPFRFLLKEYTDERMLRELEVIVREVKNRNTEPFVVGVWKFNEVRLRPDEILYISIGKNGRSNIYLAPFARKYEYDENLTSKLKLEELYEILRNSGFEYAHNSYIVNLRHIKRKSIKDLELSDGTVLTVARSKEKALRAALAKYMALKY